jgi:hypothetical protein
MDYDARNQMAGAAAMQTVSPDRPYLARLGEVADQLDQIGNYIEQFIDRCRGGGRVEGAKAGGPVPVPSGYLGQLERLTENLGRVDKLARELQVIG